MIQTEPATSCQYPCACDCADHPPFCFPDRLLNAGQSCLGFIVADFVFRKSLGMPSQSFLDAGNLLPEVTRFPVHAMNFTLKLGYLPQLVAKPRTGTTFPTAFRIHIGILIIKDMAPMAVGLVYMGIVPMYGTAVKIFLMAYRL